MSDIEMLAARVKSAQEAVNYQKSILARSRIFGWSRAAEASRLAECREELCKAQAAFSNALKEPHDDRTG